MTVAVALTFVWLGMVLSLSFIEAPLKFRAPGITRELGLGIGRIIFKTLNGMELALLVLIAAFIAIDGWSLATTWPLYLLVVMLGIQTVMLRGPMDRRAARIVGGESLPPSRQHLVYIGLEVAKVATLIALGVVLLQELT